MFDLIKKSIPDRSMPLKIWFGPFRGARVVMNPRTALRKFFGVYEHELNSWTKLALKKASRVLDVGANDGYFTFGCATALLRNHGRADIVAYEPDPIHVEELTHAVDAFYQNKNVVVTVVPKFVGKMLDERTTTLDALAVQDREKTLIKIDIEGAEIEALHGATSWINASNFFLIEVHKEAFLEPIVSMFSTRGVRLNQIEQRRHPLLGREQRDIDNRWLVSSLD